MGADSGPTEASPGSPPTPEATSPDRHKRRGSLLAAVLGASLLLIGIGCVVVSASFNREATVRLVGKEQPVNESARTPGNIDAHNSPTLVRSPARPDNLAVSSRIDTPFFSCALHVSQDGGAKWTQTAIPAPKGEEAKCFGPDVAFSADGTLYLSFVTLSGSGNTPNRAWLSTSKDGGKTLSEPKRVPGPRELSFQVRLAADPVRPGRLFMTWLQATEVGTLRFTDTDNPITAVRSDDGGASWSLPARVSSPKRQRLVTPSPVVGRDGTLYVLYLDLGEDRLNYNGGNEARGGPPYTGSYALVLSRSRDGGLSFSESVATNRIVPFERFIVFYPPYPSLEVDREGRVYAAFHSSNLGDADVWLWTLEPGAAAWSEPKRVNDTAPRDGTTQYLPKLAAAPDGRLDVLYYDRRADRQNLRNQVSLQSSFDHGQTFTRSIRLASRPSDSRIGFGAKEGLPDLGSRLALLSGDRAALGLWTDTRAGTPATQKQDLAAAAVAVSDPFRLSGSVKGALRFGGLALALAGLALLGLALGRRRPSPAPATEGDSGEDGGPGEAVGEPHEGGDPRGVGSGVDRS